MSLKVVDENNVPVSGLLMRAATLYESSPYSEFKPSEELNDFWTATTDVNGECVIRSLPAGKRIYVDHADERYAQPEGRRRYEFLLQAGNFEPHLLRLEPAATVSGRVVFSDGKPAAGVSVRALEQYFYARGGCSDETTTDVDGRYVLKRLLASDYDIGVTLPEAMREGWAETVVNGVSLEKGQELDAPDIVLTPGALVTGRVTFPDREQGVSDFVIGGSAPAATSPLVQWWTKTDSEGNFQFRLSPGDRRIYLAGAPPAGYSKPKGNAHDLALREGDREEVDFVLEASPD